MDVLLPSYLVLTFETLLCFFIASFFIPVKKDFFCFESKVSIGFFSTITFLISQVVVSFNVTHQNVSHMFILMVALVTLLSYFSLIKVKSSNFIDLFLIFLSFWYAGIFAVLFSFKLYIFLIFSLFMWSMFLIIEKLILTFNLNSYNHSILVTSQDYETLLFVKKLLGVFGAKIIAFSVSKANCYELLCSYKINPISSNFFLKYLYDRPDIDTIILDDTK